MNSSSKTDDMVRRFVELTQQLSHVESYSHELSVERGKVTAELFHGGLSFQDISKRYNACGISISADRVEQLVSKADARSRVVARVNGR